MPVLTEAITAERLNTCRDLCLIRRAERPDMSRGGIALPDSSKQISQVGEIVRVGPKVRDVKVGDMVVMSWYAGVECDAVYDERGDLLFLREGDILATIE